MVWFPAASSTISCSVCRPAANSSVLSVRLALSELLQGWACSKERCPSVVMPRDWQAPPLVSRICETTVWPSTTSEPPYTPDWPSLASKETACVPVSVPPATSGPLTSLTVGGVLATRSMSAAYTSYCEESVPGPDSGHTPPGPPPHTALHWIWVTPLRLATLTAFAGSSGLFGVPRELHPSDCAHRPWTESGPGL